MQPPELLWMHLNKISTDLLAADMSLADLLSGDNNRNGLTRDDLAAIIWRETDRPTSAVHPSIYGLGWQGWNMPKEYHPLGMIFDPAERWMRQSEGRIIALIDLLEDEQDRIRYRGVAIGVSKREDAPEPTERERAEEAQCRWERVVWLARVILSARGCGALVQLPLRQPARAPAQRPLMVVDGGQSEPDGNLALTGLEKFME